MQHEICILPAAANKSKLYKNTLGLIQLFSSNVQQRVAEICKNIKSNLVYISPNIHRHVAYRVAHG